MRAKAVNKTACRACESSRGHHIFDQIKKELAKTNHTSQSAIARTEKGDYLGYSLRTLGKIAVGTGSKLEVSIK